jgi:hypothetical protein
MENQPTAPQSIGGVLDAGFKLFMASLKHTFVLAVVAALIYAPFAQVARELAVRPVPPGVVGRAILAFILLVLLSPIVMAAILVRTDAVARGGAVTLWQALASGVRRLPALLGAGVLLTLILVIGGSALGAVIGLVVGAAGFSPIVTAAVVLAVVVIPMLILTVYLLFVPYGIVTDRLGPVTGISYSWSLVHGHWWRTAILVTIIGIIVSVLYVVLVIVIGVVAVSNVEQAAQGRIPWYVNFVLTPLFSGVIAPLMYSMLLAVFHDLKLRREGGDLAERIEAASA